LFLHRCLLLSVNLERSVWTNQGAKAASRAFALRVDEFRGMVASLAHVVGGSQKVLWTNVDA